MKYNIMRVAKALLLGALVTAAAGCATTYKIEVVQMEGSNDVRRVEFTREQDQKLFDRIDGLIPSARSRLGPRLYPSEYVFAGKPSYRVTLYGPPHTFMVLDAGWVTDFQMLHQWQLDDQWVYAPEKDWQGEWMGKDYRARLDDLLEAAKEALRLPTATAPTPRHPPAGSRPGD